MLLLLYFSLRFCCHLIYLLPKCTFLLEVLLSPCLPTTWLYFWFRYHRLRLLGLLPEYIYRWYITVFFFGLFSLWLNFPSVKYHRKQPNDLTSSISLAIFYLWTWWKELYRVSRNLVFSVRSLEVWFPIWLYLITLRKFKRLRLKKISQMLYQMINCTLIIEDHCERI